MASYVLAASRPGVGSVVVTGSAAAVAAQVAGVGVVVEAGSGPAAGSGAGAGGVTAHHISRRRIMQMVNDNPRLARKLGIRGKLQILE